MIGRKNHGLTRVLAKEVVDEKLTPRELVETLIDKVLVFPGDRLGIQWKIADFAITQ